MGLLDQVAGALAGGESGGSSALLQAALQLINNPQTGGLEGIIRSFQQGGLGDVVNSWVATVSKRSIRRAPSNTFAPSAPKARAAAAPKPDEAPVTNTHLPFNRDVMRG